MANRLIFIILSFIAFPSCATNHISVGIELIKDDYNGYMNGGTSAINYYGGDYKSASTLIKEFDNNQVRYNKDYTDNYVYIKTIVSAVKSYPNGSAYVIANGRNNYEYITMEVDKNSEKVLNLKRNDPLQMVCIGRARSVALPEMRDCVFSDDFAKARMDIYLAHLQSKEFAQGNYLYQPDFFISVMIELAKNKGVCENACSIEEVKKLFNDLDKEPTQSVSKQKIKEFGEERYKALPQFPFPPKPRGSSRLATMYK